MDQEKEQEVLQEFQFERVYNAPEVLVPSISKTSSFDKNSSSEDPDERFLLSCAPILKRLTNKKNVLAKIKIQTLLYELEYDEKYSG